MICDSGLLPCSGPIFSSSRAEIRLVPGPAIVRGGPLSNHGILTPAYWLSKHVFNKMR